MATNFSRHQQDAFNKRKAIAVIEPEKEVVKEEKQVSIEDKSSKKDKKKK